MLASREFVDISSEERWLLAELAKEVPSKMIAKQLGISEASLYCRVRSLRRKLGVMRRVEAIEIGRSETQV